MFKRRFLPALVCGFGIAVVSIIPVIQALSCCLFVPLAGGLGIYLYFKQTYGSPDFRIEFSDALIMGLLIGLISGFFDAIFQTIMISISNVNPVEDAIFIIRQYFSELEIPSIINDIAKDIGEDRFSLLLSILIFFNNLIINSIFATIGGMIGISIIKKRLNVS